MEDRERERENDAHIAGAFSFKHPEPLAIQGACRQQQYAAAAAAAAAGIPIRHLFLLSLPDESLIDDVQGLEKETLCPFKFCPPQSPTAETPQNRSNVS